MNTMQKAVMILLISMGPVTSLWAANAQEEYWVVFNDTADKTSYVRADNNNERTCLVRGRALPGGELVIVEFHVLYTDKAENTVSGKVLLVPTKTSGWTFPEILDYTPAAVMLWSAQCANSYNGLPPELRTAAQKVQ